MPKPPERFLHCESCDDEVLHAKPRVGLSRWGVIVPLILIAWLTKLRLIAFVFLTLLWFVWAYHRIWSKNRSGIWVCNQCGSRQLFDASAPPSNGATS